MIVSDSTPLVAFARLGRLDLLRRIVQHVLIPQAVMQEFTEGKNRPGAEEIRSASWVEVRVVGTIPPEILPLLDRGEAEVIALAEEVSADELLLDERAARAVAVARGLRVIGTAGLLVRAKEQGMINAVRPILEQMQARGIRYSRQFLDDLFREQGE
jgi:predicted nucleic acid-binding protein